MTAFNINIKSVILFIIAQFIIPCTNNLNAAYEWNYGAFFDGPNEIPMIPNIIGIDDYKYSWNCLSINNDGFALTKENSLCYFYLRASDILISFDNMGGFASAVYNDDHSELIIPNGSRMISAGEEWRCPDYAVKLYNYSFTSNGTVEITENTEYDNILFNVNSDGEIVFSEEYKNVAIGFERNGKFLDYLIISPSFYKTVSEQSDIMYPQGLEFEPYEMKYSTFHYANGDGRRRLVKIAKDQDYVYIQHLCTMLPYACIKGRPIDDNIIFSTNQQIGLGRYMCKLEYELIETSIYNQSYIMIPQKNDLKFEYDSNSGNYSTKEKFGFTPNPIVNWKVSVSEGGDFNPNNIDQYYGMMNLTPIPRKQIPMAPHIKIEKEYAIVRLPGVDINDVLLEKLNNLYLKILIDDTPVYFECKSLGKVEEYPFYGDSSDYLTTHARIQSGIGGYGRVQIKLPKDYEDIEAQAIYYNETERIVASSKAESGIKNAEYASDIHSSYYIYDLVGNKYSSTEDLPPGLYIRNGKKIIVK